jgi:hypothetical protein
LTERVLAVHKVTGLITEVLPIEIENHEALELATDKQIKEAQRKREIEVYGEPIKNGVIPEGPVGPPLEDAPAPATTTSKDGADNG